MARTFWTTYKCKNIFILFSLFSFFKNLNTARWSVRNFVVIITFQLGKHQVLMLGRYLRQRYDHILPKIYSHHDIFVQSTDVDRTLMSAECNLAGLYPPVENQVWDEVKWMPIPVHTVPRKQDQVLAGKKYCSNYNKELQKILTSGEIDHINKQNEQLYSFLTEKSGDNIHDLDTLSSLYDTLYIEVQTS